MPVRLFISDSGIEKAVLRERDGSQGFRGNGGKRLAGDRDGNHEGKALDDGAERQLAKYVPPSPDHSESAVAQST
jgi:hypothetical protein